RRNFDALLENCRDENVKNAVAAWLPGGRIDQKRLDALALLDAVAAWRESGAPAPQTRFHFERTTLFDKAMLEIAADRGTSS
ncbi:hypothetical protein JZU69_02790, partial [bacterium]|nr:hypothetical protein [bacterium]